MSVTFNRGDGIVVLGAAIDEIVFDRPEYVDHIVLNATAAGAFTYDIGNAAVAQNNSANDLSIWTPIKRRVNRIKLKTGPTNASMMIYLGKKGM